MDDFYIGQQVRFLNEPVSGIIIHILSKNEIEIETSDGFNLKTNKNQIVPVNSLEETIQQKPVKLYKDYPHYNLGASSKKFSGKIEFDLHIEKLLPKFREMSHGEIIQFQLNTFENKLTESIQFRKSPVLFIHGVGNGILREEIHKRLKKNPFVDRYENKGKDLMGFGATLVFLKF